MRRFLMISHMNSFVRQLCLGLVAGVGMSLGGGQAGADDWSLPLDAFLKQHCSSCHADGAREGGFDLDKISRNLSDPDVLNKWVRLYDRVIHGEMPPKDEERPPATASMSFLNSLSSALLKADAARNHQRIRRLNRVEYENTVRDLFQIRVDLQAMLPEDQRTYGFDTVASGLGISATQMEIYLRAAEAAIDAAYGPVREPKRMSVSMPLGRDSFPAKQIGNLFQKTDEDGLMIFRDGWCPAIFATGKATEDGTYRVRIQVKGHRLKRPQPLAVYGGNVIVGSGKLVGYYDIPLGDDWTTVEFEHFLTKGGSYKMVPYGMTGENGVARFDSPGLVIGEISMEGPLEPWPPLSRVQLLGDVDPKSGSLEDARKILGQILPRAFRRSTTPEELEPYVALTQQALEEKRSFEEALKVGLQGILCSPHFLLRDAPPEIRPQSDDAALASRLSYFFWSSMPDERLLALAGEGQLSRPEVLRDEVDRMLNDPKSDRFVENFIGQWLGLREIDFTEPDRVLFPEYDEMLRLSMLEESRRYFREILDNDLPVYDFVDSNWTILNERLALHYGIDGVYGQEFRRVELPAESVRGGVITQASVLKITANGTNTSPVVRGVWVLRNIMGETVLPPPPNVGAIEPDIRGATTMREQLDKHRNIAACASCHRRIDPPGFALEGFDPIGGERVFYRSISPGDIPKWIRNFPEYPPTQDALTEKFGPGDKIPYHETNGKLGRRPYRRGLDVDSSGITANGIKFTDVREFKRDLMQHPEFFTTCLTEKLLIYSLGRSMGFSDRSEIAEIVTKVSSKQSGFRTMIHEIVQSKEFQSL